MNRFGAVVTPVFAAACLTATCIGSASAISADKAIDLAAHRAIYDLKLSFSRGQRPIESVRGRILYDFNGNACEGYALQFRQVTEIDAGEGKLLTSDLRAATWEDAIGKTFRFNSQNYVDDKLVESVDGKAERKDGAVDVNLTKPDGKTFNVEADAIFPTQHIRRIIEAARSGTTVLELPIYDGSETGQKVYDTLTVIGHPIAPAINPPADAAAGQAALAGLTRWPVTISYFDKSKHNGEQIPVYSIRMELYENGISRALSLDYNDFVISGEMTLLDIKPSPDKKTSDCGQ